MPYLSWINDYELEYAVNHLLSKAKEAQINAETQFGKNVIDPFAALFEISGFEIEYSNWFKNETTRQAQKTLQNHIGDFHQIILGACMGWRNLKTGNVVDLVSDEKKIIAELKNKHNTISGGKLSDLYYSLESLVMPKSSIYKGYTAYYVTIIPKSPKKFDKPFTPSDKSKSEKCYSNEKIRHIDGSSFYDLVTGKNESLNSLFEVIPAVIYNCSNGKYRVRNIESLKNFFYKAFG